jgi:hypothetical protein
VRVLCAHGIPRIVNARIPAGIKDKQSIRLSHAKLPDGINWPAEGITIPVRVRDRRPAHTLVAVTVLAGAIAQAWGYAAAVAATWALILFCLRYARTHAPEGLAPAAPGRLWSLFRYNLAKAGVLYLIPIGSAVTFYLYLAAALALFDNILKLGQLLSLQTGLENTSDFFSDWIKLDEGPVLFLLIAAYLLTCLLLSWRSTGSTGSGTRRKAVQVIRTTTDFYCRYSGPAAAGLAALAAFTFLGVRAGEQNTAFALKIKTSEQDYDKAARKVESELTGRATALLYEKIKNSMPSEYQATLVLPVRIDRTVTAAQRRADEARTKHGIQDPDADAFLDREQERMKKAADAKADWIVAGDGTTRPAGAPSDLTPAQTGAAREWLGTAAPDNRIDIMTEGEKKIALQVEKIISEPLTGFVKDLSKTIPLLEPLLDAFFEACDATLQDRLTAAADRIMKVVMGRPGAARAAVDAAATQIVAQTDVTEPVKHAEPRAKQQAAEWGRKSAKLKESERRINRRVTNKLIRDIQHPSKAIQTSTADKLISEPAGVQKATVDRLRSTMNTRTGSVRRSAAHSIFLLEPRLPHLISPAQGRAAGGICGCRWL